MKRILVLFLGLVLFQNNIYSQCGGPPLTVTNPSFEGTPAPHITPPGWDICMPGVTPDTQPGSWGVTLPPSNGSSYIGLVYAPSIPWQEGAGQNLSAPMAAGTNYNFTIDLATMASADPLTGIVLPPYCGQIQLWGGMAGVNSGCDQSELLWTSPVITNTSWVTYNLSFTPTQNWNHILFVIYAQPPACTDGQYILMDNMTPIIPDADIAAFSATTVCQGSTTIFTDGSTSSSGTITNWNWDFGDGGPGSTQQNPTHTYTSPGIYNVSLTIISNIPCTTNVVQQVTVNPIPVVGISASPASVCAGQPAVLTAAGADTYSWSHGLGSGNPVNVFPSSTTTYTVTGSSLGCTSSATITIASGSMDLSGQVNQHVSCYGGNDGSASVNVITGTPPYTYSWSPAGGSGSSAVNLNAGPYVVTVSDSMGCQDTVNITINQPAELIADITDSTHVLCYGASTGNATVSVTGGTPPYTYLWMPAGGTGPTTTGIPAGIYQVNVTDDHGCSTYQLVTIQQSPAVNIAITPVNVACPGDCNGSATVLATGGIPPYLYNWATTPPQTNQTINNLCTGNYTVYVTDGNNCVFSESTTIETNSDAHAVFSAYPMEGVIPLNVDFTYTGSAAATWLWDFGDGSTSLLPDPSHTYTESGIYTVTLIVTSGPPDFCADTFRMEIMAIQPSSIVVPNVFTPNGDGHNDEFAPETVAIEHLKAVIYNRWGKIVYEWDGVEGAWNGEHKTGGKCADGTYYYIIEAEGYDSMEYKLHGTVTLLK